MLHEILCHRIDAKEDANAGVVVQAIGAYGAGGAPDLYRLAWAGNSPDPEKDEVVLEFAKAGRPGLTNEALLAVVLDRLEGFQAGPFSCRENAVAIESLVAVLEALKARTRRRIAAGVEGRLTEAPSCSNC